jgi:hypothetical protein
MDKYLNKLKEDNYDDSFNKTSEWLTNSEIKLKSQKERKTFSMIEFIKTNKYKFAFIILILAIFGACNYPVTQTDTVGYIIKWSTPAENTDNNITAALPWLKNVIVNTEIKTVGGESVKEYTAVFQGSDEKTVTGYKNDLEKISSIISIKIFPVSESVKRPVYSAILYSFFKIDIKSDNM